jgi:hypothetical protein
VRRRNAISYLAAVALLIAATAPPRAEEAPPDATWIKAHASALALDVFQHLQAGQIDRAQLTPLYNQQLTDGAVKEMARHLKSYGAPTGGDLLQTHTIDTQTFTLVKLLFERGEALTMMIDYDADRKITAISFPNMGQD